MPVRDIAGRVAVVIGAGSGVGRGVALGLASAGATVITADLDPGADEQVDATDPAALSALADRVVQQHGAVHILVCTAGAIMDGPLAAATDADWAWMVEANLYSQLRPVRAFLPALTASTGLRYILTTSAPAGLAVPDAGLGLYATVKHAVIGYTDALREELRPSGIGVGVLLPHRVRGGLAHGSVRSRARADGIGIDPVHPPGDDLSTPEEIGPGVVAAIAERHPYIVTRHLELDGARERLHRLQIANSRF